MKLGDPYRLSCGHTGRIIWVSRDRATFAVRAPRGAWSCCNTKGNPTIFLVETPDRNPQTVFNPSHLSTLVSRFLRTLEDLKTWNHLEGLRGEAQLRQHLSNIIEYTFYYHTQQIADQEVERLVDLLQASPTS